MRSGFMSSGRGIPATVERRGTGTIVSPCPPSTNAETSDDETPRSWAMKVRNRPLSRTPAMPMTRSRGKPLASSATWTMASRGLVTMIRIESGE